MLGPRAESFSYERVDLKPASIFSVACFLKTGLQKNLAFSTRDLQNLSLTNPRTKSYLLTQAVRQTAFDDTGIVPHLLGVAHNPQDTLMHMMPAATEALNWLKSQGKEVEEETLNALLHNGPCSINSLSNLDEMWGSIVNKVKGMAYDMGLVKDIGQMTPEAWMFKNENVESFEALEKLLHLKDLVNRCLVMDGGGNLIDITEKLIVPSVPKDQVAKLSEILPDVFNRNIDTPREYLNLEAQILKELGRVGNDFTRTLIMMMRDKQTIQRMDKHSY